MTTYDPPLLPGSEGYIDPADPHEPECDAVSPRDGIVSFLCTLAAGHEDDHAAHGVGGRLLATWPREEAP